MKERRKPFTDSRNLTALTYTNGHVKIASNGKQVWVPRKDDDMGKYKASGPSPKTKPSRSSSGSSPRVKQMTAHPMEMGPSDPTSRLTFNKGSKPMPKPGGSKTCR